jgi:hypothetical protein
MTPLELVRAKIGRAVKHIGDLEAAVLAFLYGHPYEISLDYNDQTGQYEWSLVKAAEIPTSIPIIAGDAIHNLRSVLDHLVWQLILTQGQKPRPGVTGFPITETLEEYRTPKIRRKIEGVGPIAEATIDALQPYKGGNDALWRLHCLNNIDKHRLILSAASAMSHHHLLPSQKLEITEMFYGSYPDASAPPDLSGVFIKPRAAAFPLEVGKKFFTLPRSEMEKDFTFKLNVAFNEPGIVQGETIVETVKQLSGLVIQIVDTLTPLLL